MESPAGWAPIKGLMANGKSTRVAKRTLRKNRAVRGGAPKGREALRERPHRTKRPARKMIPTQRWPRKETRKFWFGRKWWIKRKLKVQTAKVPHPKGKSHF